MSEILLILVFALLVYGGRLPEVARSLGRAISTVKQNLTATQASITETLDQATDIDDRPRTVRRVAPPEVAREDVSGTPEAVPEPDAAEPRAEAPADAPTAGLTAAPVTPPDAATASTPPPAHPQP